MTFLILTKRFKRNKIKGKEGEMMKISLKAARINQRYTQKQAAALLGISAETLISWEKGRTFPNIKAIEKIEKLYQITYDEIYFCV